ncbi:MAG TPA: potassium channel family protein [Caulobacteraceae bacterium]|nr:potassium channel family protein [Caulobacteraceae bacterium]
MAAQILALVLAGLLLTLVLQDAFEVMLLPRRVHRRARLMRLFFVGSWTVWARVGRAIPKPAQREKFLCVYGPLAMMILFAVWAALLIVGFGLLQWALQARLGGRPSSPLAAQFYLSGVTFFTLGFGDVVPHTSAGRIVAVAEAGTGFGFIAVVIGYLPVLYQLFSRREAHIIQLDGRAGSPPSPVELLRRHAESGGLEKLDELLRAWEIWGAELLESHLSYPMLAYYRSQHDDQSWLAALTTIMDACALILVGVEDIKPLQARMTFAIAREVVIELAWSFWIPPRSPTSETRLGAADFESMLALFEEVGLKWNGGPDAEQTLAAVRATYEPQVEGLAHYLLIPLSGWLPQDATPDHWERGARGIIARRLVRGLSDGSIGAEASDAGGDSANLRQSLRDLPGRRG